MTGHAYLSPSAAHRWTRCAGSARAQYGLPDIETEAAREGTAMHELAAEHLQSGEVVSDAVVGRVMSNGVTIDLELVQAVDVYVEYVRNTLAGGAHLRVEKPVDLSFIAPGMFGTVDADGFDPRGALHVFDFKGGHDPVYAVGNEQLELYGLGALGFYGFPDVDVFLHIVQPRAFVPGGPFRVVHTNTRELLGRVDAYRSAAAAAMEGRTLTPGDHCRYCLALGSTCAVARQTGYAFASAAATFDTHGLTPAEKATDLQFVERAAAFLKAKAEAMRAEVEHDLQTGAVIPGYVLASEPGAMRWTVDDDSVHMIADLLGVKSSKTVTLTPRQVIDGAPKKMRPTVEEAVKAVAARSMGGPKLTKTTDSPLAAVFLNVNK